MSANQAGFSVATMCRVLGLSESAYYASRQRPPSARSLMDSWLLERIQASHAASRGTYGAPRVHADLAAEGIHVGEKRVARLMRNAGHPLTGNLRHAEAACWHQAYLPRMMPQRPVCPRSSRAGKSPCK